MIKEITKISAFPSTESSQILNGIAHITPDYYVMQYKIFIPRYIANGRTSQDTLASYFSSIDQFLVWCAAVDRHPLRLTEPDLIVYRDWLQNVRHYRDASIKAKIVAIRKFFQVAVKYGLIKENPAIDVHCNIRDYNMVMEMKFLSQEQLHTLFQSVYFKYNDYGELKLLRDSAMVALMAVEGCRTVEVHRLSEEDINWKLNTILIKGKTRNDFIYPSPDTMDLLKNYLEEKKRNIPNSYQPAEILTPVFVSLSRNCTFHRISRRRIRDTIDLLFSNMGIKKQGMSAHALRHTCGTLAYSALKDLLKVKEILRHKDINMTTVYAHLVDRLSNRYTSVITIQDAGHDRNLSN